MYSTVIKQKSVWQLQSASACVVLHIFTLIYLTASYTSELSILTNSITQLLCCQLEMSHSATHSGRLSPSATQEITIVYQGQSAHPQEIHLLSIQVRNVSDPQLAYSRFKTSVCRQFQLPKSTPFMLKDTVSGAKMTRDRFSEFLRARAFPLVWRLITALPGEEGTRLPLSHADSCATGTTDSSCHCELMSQSSCSLSETHSLHSLAHTLSLGWNDNTNSYGLETKCLTVPFLDRQLVFISKRAQNLALSPPPGQSLSVGDLILKIDSRPVEEMSREEICLHLNYPQANLAPLSLLMLPWTDCPQQLKELTLESLQSDQEPTSRLVPPDPNPLPATSSEPCFWSIPSTSIDDPLSPAPCTSPRKRKSRHPFSTGSPGDPYPFSSKTSPSKKMGLLTPTRVRLRSSSVSRSDSFSFIPSCPPGDQQIPSCTPEDPSVFSPATDTIHTSHKPELIVSPCDVFPDPDTDRPQLAVSEPEPELTTPPAAILPEPNSISADLNPEDTLVPIETEPEPTLVPADTDVELTLIPSLHESELEPTFSLFVPPIPELRPDAIPMQLETAFSRRYSRSVSDPKANRVEPSRDLSSSSSDMETEGVTGMYNLSYSPRADVSLMRHHHYELLDDSSESAKSAPRQKTSSNPLKHSSSSESKNRTLEKLDSFRKLIASSRPDTSAAATDMPRVADSSTTIVSACAEFVNPSFQGPVHGIYRSFDPNLPSSKRPHSKRRFTSHMDTMDIDLYTHTKSTSEIAYFDSSSDGSDSETGPFRTSRHMSAVPIGLITPVRPRKFPHSRESSDNRPLSDMLPRSTSEGINLSGTPLFFEDPNNMGSSRARMARKQKSMLLSPNSESIDFPPGFLSPSAQVPNGKGHSFSPDKVTDRKTQSNFYSGKPAEFIHPAYRPYQSIGNMEISERMCAKLREKFQPISSGPLSRKHEFDGRLRRRATDRGWKSMYVHLLESDLIFYKSERDYQFDRPFLKTLSRDKTERHFLYDQIVSLHHAKLYIPNDYMALKRNCTSYVFRIETENTSAYLIRAVSLPLMFGWILSFVEARVLPPTDHPHSTGLFQDPDKRRKTTIEGANRYLQRIQQKVKCRLNFVRKDSELSLEPIFCCDLSRCVRAPGNDKLPLLVEMCVREIEDRALESQGIYRVSGTSRHIKSLREDFSRGQELEPEDERWMDENNIAGLFKLFFKELSEPLVSPQLYNSLIATVNKETDSQGQLIRDLQKLAHTMPDMNLCTLDYVVAHLCRVAQLANKNKMSVRNLAIVFGPTLITRRDLTSIELISQTNSQVCVMEQLILSYEHIFNCVPVPDALFNSRRSPSTLSSHALVRAARNSNSAIPSDRIRRVSSTDPPHPLPSNTPPPPHLALESKLSRSWSEEVLSHASLIGESFGSDLFRVIPLHSLLESNTAHTLPPRLQGIEYNSHPLSSAQWYSPSLDTPGPSCARRDSN